MQGVGHALPFYREPKPARMVGMVVMQGYGAGGGPLLDYSSPTIMGIHPSALRAMAPTILRGLL